MWWCKLKRFVFWFCRSGSQLRESCFIVEMLQILRVTIRLCLEHLLFLFLCFLTLFFPFPFSLCFLCFVSCHFLFASVSSFSHPVSLFAVQVSILSSHNLFVSLFVLPLLHLCLLSSIPLYIIISSSSSPLAPSVLSHTLRCRWVPVSAQLLLAAAYCIRPWLIQWGKSITLWAWPLRQLICLE